MEPSAAIDVLVQYSRLVSVGDIAPREVFERLAQTAHEQGLVDAVVVVEVSPRGEPIAVASRGVDLDGRLDVEGLGEELERLALTRRPDCEHVFTLPLVSSGGLFGSVVLLWDGRRPDDTGVKLVEGLVDITAMALDRAHQTRSLQSAMDELARSQEALTRKEKLEALGQMAAIVAHEVKNPLASVSGALQVLGSRMTEGSQDLRVVDLILERVTGLAKMVDELLVFARPRPPLLSRVRLDYLLDGPAELFRADPHFSSVELTVRVTPQDVSLLADPSVIQPVLSNLLLNAAQAMEGTGEIALTGRLVDGSVQIVVQDSGPGIPADQRDRVFEPFVTTKTRGSGLGLAVAAQAMEAHGGRVRLADTGPPGATFILDFPQSVAG